MCKDPVETNHPIVVLDNFEDLINGYRHRKFKKKLSQYLFTEHSRPLD